MLVGAAADAEGLFGRLARPLTKTDASPVVVLAGLLALDAAVTAVLNLDTAAAFMTPLMLYAARGLGTDEAPFLYGAVLMANAGSLFLPGSNLTNLLVLHGDPVSGLSFLGTMLPAALVAVAVTGAGLLVWAARTGRADPGAVPASPAWRPGPGVAAVGVSAVLVLALRDPALPVLGVGLVVAVVRLDRAQALKAVGPVALVALLVLAVVLGTLAREVELFHDLGRWSSAGVAALASVLVNNLPAAALLSARPPLHPEELLLGLNLGPNLAVTGSLSALIWWRTARRLGAQPSVWRYSAAGAPLAVVSLTLGTLSLSG